MVYYAVIDTNVLISAMLKWNSVPGNVLELIFSGTIIPVLNDDILTEYRGVLSRPKFRFTQDIINTVVGEIERLGIRIDAPTLNIDLPDPKDRVFYEIVMEERRSTDAYLVTGNISIFPSSLSSSLPDRWSTSSSKICQNNMISQKASITG